MSQQQLNGLLSSLKADERQPRKGHWVDVFHEEDGESTGQPGQGVAKVGVHELKKCLATIDKRCSGRVGLERPKLLPS